MKVALWQGRSPAGDGALAVAQLETALAAAGAAGAAVLVAPEVWMPGYNQPDIPARALPPDAPQLRALADACLKARCALVLGYAERDGDTVHNAALAIGPDGRTLANYRKVQLYGARERSLYAPGAAYVTFPLAGVTAGLLICYDVEFDTHVAALAAQGATLILVPTANMQPFVHVIRHTVPAMAANHAVSIVYANFCGVEGDLTYVGGSLIAGPHGEVLAQAGDHPALLIAELPPLDPARAATQARDLRVL